MVRCDDCARVFYVILANVINVFFMVQFSRFWILYQNYINGEIYEINFFGTKK